MLSALKVGPGGTLASDTPAARNHSDQLGVASGSVLQSRWIRLRLARSPGAPDGPFHPG